MQLLRKTIIYRDQIFNHKHVRERVDLGRLAEIVVDLATKMFRLVDSFNSLPYLAKIYHKHANVFVPLMFMAHEPQMPSRHERLNVNVGSTSFLILMSASNTIIPVLVKNDYLNFWFNQYYCKINKHLLVQVKFIFFKVWFLSLLFRILTFNYDIRLKKYIKINFSFSLN